MSWKSARGRFVGFNRPIAFRIAFSLGVAGATLLLMLCTALYWLVYWQISQDDNRFMDDITSLVQANLASQDSMLSILGRQIPQELAAFHFNRYQVRIVPEDKPKLPLFQSPHFPLLVLPRLETLPVYPLNSTAGDGSVMHLPDGKSFLVLAIRARTGQPSPKAVIVQLALDITSKVHLLKHLQVNLLLFILIGTLLFSLLGTLLVRRGLIPLRDFGALIQGIGMDSLDQRVNAQHWPTELQPLAESFDRLLIRLQKDIDQMTRFSGDLAHELRTPITNLRVEMEVLLENSRTIQEYRTGLENGLGELERLSNLVERILWLSRVEHPHFSVNWKTFAVRPLVDKLLDFYTMLAEEKRITVRVRGELTLNADPQLIEQAIGNLLSNAIKYTPPNGQVEVSLYLHEAPLAQTVAVISVSDTGYGIEPEHFAHIFDRFYRGDRSRSQLIPGDGLGLAIVKSIMEIHQGDIDVQSKPGQGSCFSLYFRISQN